MPFKMDPDSFEELISCRVCYDIFNEGNRRPRILNCGHSFCHSCLETLLLSIPLCPMCKADVQFTRVGSIPINFIVKDLISAMGLEIKDGAKFKICKSSKVSNNIKNKSKKRLESFYLRTKGFETYRNKEKKSFSEFQNLSIPKRPPRRIKSFYTRKKKSNESGLLNFASQQVNPIATYCDKHKNKYTLMCADCEILICDICATTSNHNRCKTLSVEDYYDGKKRIIRKIDKHLLTNAKLSEKITNSLNILNIKNKSLIIEINNRQIKFKNNSKRIKELETKNFEKLKFFEELKCLQALVENSATDEELFNAKIEIERAIDQQKNQTSTSHRICRSKFHSERQQSLLTLCKTESVYVTEGSLFGRVKARKEKLWISSFSSVKPTAKMISFRRLLRTLTGSTNLPTKVFLQLIPPSRSATNPPNENGIDIAYLDIVIDTFKSSPNAAEFVLSCAGLKGQSCKGRILIYSSSSYTMNPELSSDVIGSSFRDHQSNSSTIGQVLGTGSLESGFRIALEPFKYQHEFPLGTVSSGFQNLKSLRRNAYVKDCGFVV